MSTQNISTKICIYGCGLNLYWNTAPNEYWEVFTKKKHVCPNRQQQSKPTISTTATIPKYYNRFTKQPKPKTSNSIELISGPISEVQKKYEVLSDIVTEYIGKVHGSQSLIIQNNSISLVVYYEVHEGKRDEVKRKI